MTPDLTLTLDVSEYTLTSLDSEEGGKTKNTIKGNQDLGLFLVVSIWIISTYKGSVCKVHQQYVTITIIPKHKLQLLPSVNHTLKLDI